ncbi:MAG TPA: nucleotidyltransferase domain-containing protein [Candidatus Nanoarchaeia archaeon]|nr:nucleotidyltransferase domain-containing protein [Candidatus Nanoarchaeia archaeon]
MEINKKKLKNYIISDLEHAWEKVIHWFFAYPTDELSLSNLCRELKISKTSASEVVRELENEGFIEKKVLGRVWRLKANQEHPYFTSKKIASNLMMVYESGIIPVVLGRFPNSRAIVLFGSYRKGDDMQESDIDIAVEVLDNKPVRIIGLGNINQFGFRKNVKVNAHVFSRNHVDLNLFANIANGIVLHGFLEVRP